MTELRLCPVSETNFEAFTRSFNLAYSDYVVPIVMSPPSFRALMRRDDLRPDASVAALDGDRIVGTGLLGIRGKTGWIGGMGVIPEYRGRGIGRQMMCYLLDQARARGITHISLEVFENNDPARTLYEHLGFERVRYLLLAERAPAPFKALLPPSNVVARSPYELLDYYDAFHETANCWQRDLPSLRALTDSVDGWAVVHDGTVHGYALGTVDYRNIRLVDFAVDPSVTDADVALALLGTLHKRHTNAHGSTYNIAEDDPFWRAFEALDYEVPLRQIQMIYQIA